MSKPKDFKETFKRCDQYLKGEISWEDFDMSAVLNKSPSMRLSEIDNIFGELETEGEDRVFGANSKFAVSPLHPSLPVKSTKDVINAKLKKESGVVIRDGGDGKKIENQLQGPKKAPEEKDTIEDWVVIGNDDINDKN